VNKILAITTATTKVATLPAKMLDFTLKYNLNQIDDILIITDFHSEEIERVCNKYNVKFIKTSKFYENGATFDKGKVISNVLKNIKNQWVLHIDCDILLPKSFKDQINKLTLDKNKLYGARRIMFKNLENVKKWFDFNESPQTLSDLIPYGYCWGYFQLFNMDSAQIRLSDPNNIYPASGHVGDSDGWFRNKWGIMKEKDYKKDKFLPSAEDLMVAGNIEELPFLVGHLGDSNVTLNNNQDFFN